MLGIIGQMHYHQLEALFGIFGARMGLLILDSIASVVISVFIVKSGVEIFIQTIRELTDEACDEETINKIYNVINKQTGVMRIDDVKTRKFGNKIYVDVEISADGEKTLIETHKIAENIHDAVEKEIEFVKHCMVHVNPY